MHPDPRHSLTTSDIAAGSATLLIPVGAWEQHGAHLPLATDSLIAERLCLSVAEKARESVVQIVVAPTVTITASDEHRDFAGTLSLGTDNTASALTALVRSAWWARTVIIVNGHGGNADALQMTRTHLTKTHLEKMNTPDSTPGGDTQTVLMWWPRTPVSFLPAMAADLHAGHIETSVMLHQFPDLVRMSAAECGATGDVDTLTAGMRAQGLRGVSDNGVIGDPTSASADDGRVIWNTWIDDLFRFVSENVARP